MGFFKLSKKLPLEIKLRCKNNIILRLNLMELIILSKNIPLHINFRCKKHNIKVISNEIFLYCLKRSH